MNDEVLAFTSSDGEIKITADMDKISFHKNGLKIEVPIDVLDEFNRALEGQVQKLDIEIRELFKARLRGEK